MRRAVVAAVCAVGLIAAGPAAAAPKFTKPRAVTPPNSIGLVAEPDAGGSITLAWTSTTVGGGYTVQTRRIADDGKAGPIYTLDETGDRFPALAVAPDGSATVVWADAGHARLETARIAPDGTPGAVQTVHQGASFGADVGVDAQGRATIVWPSGMARVSPDGAVAPEQSLGTQMFSPRVGVEPNGRASIAGPVEATPGGWVVQVVRVQADGTIESPRDISPPGSAAPFATPTLALAADGAVNVVWGYGAVQLARLGADGTPGPYSVLSGTEPTRDEVLAVGPSGRTTVAWNPKGPSIDFRQIEADGTVGRVHGLAPMEEGQKTSPKLVSDRRGRISAGWMLEPRKGGPVNQVARLRADGRTGKVSTLPGGPEESRIAVLVTDARGRRTVFTQSPPEFLFEPEGQFRMVRERD
jgi:hypothetical protein